MDCVLEKRLLIFLGELRYMGIEENILILNLATQSVVDEWVAVASSERLLEKWTLRCLLYQKNQDLNSNTLPPVTIGTLNLRNAF